MSNTSLEVKEITQGSVIVRAGEHAFALGFPEEIVKAWMKAGVQPTGWIIPDVRAAHGIVQWALEFPLYHALFIRRTFSNGHKIPVLVERAAWPAVVEYLRLTLLGLSRDEMRTIGVDPAMAEMLAKESDHLALKRKDGSVAPIEDFLQPVFFDETGIATHAGLSVKRHGNNVYSFVTADDRIDEYALVVPAGQAPVYDLTPAPIASVPERFALTVLGASNGFDASNPCSNLVVQQNGRFLLVDSGPFIRCTLAHAGIGLHQLSGVVITHAHEDHAVGLSALLEARQRLTLFASRENAEILRRKLAILNPDVFAPERLLDDAFDLVVIDTTRPFAHAGLELRFHYTFHSIPCTGLEVSCAGRRVLIMGDSAARAHIDAAGVFSAERYAQLTALYDWRGDLILADAGEGQIHGAPADFANNESSVVYFHTGKLKEEDRLSYTLARAGDKFTLAPEAPTAVERAMGLRALSAAFPGTEIDALDVMLDAAVAQSCVRDQVLVREGDASRDMFVVVGGELVAYRGKEALGRIGAGEVCGERAAVNDAPRSATLVAATPSRLLRVPGDVFARVAVGLRATLQDAWEKRRALDAVALLFEASAAMKQALAQLAVKRTIAPGATLIRERSSSSTVFVLVQGRVQVYKGTEPLLVQGAPVIVEPGTLIGETAPFLDKARNASIVTLDECEVLAIRGSDFKKIVERSPQLFCRISRTVRARVAA